ncbi:hypothetical protein ACHWQZ_G015985 [Mnemiopsis leidyi]
MVFYLLLEVLVSAVSRREFLGYKCCLLLRRVVLCRQMYELVESWVPMAKGSSMIQRTKQDLAVGSRKKNATLAQLKSGHSLLLAAYRHRKNEEESKTCPSCNEEPQTLEHWLKCPGTSEKRQEFFGKTDISPAALGEHPLESLVLARATLGRL